MQAKSDGGANQVQKLTSVSPPTAKVCRLCPCMHVYDFRAIIITSPLLCSSVQDPSSQAGCSTLPLLSSQPADWHLHFSIPERESFSGSVQRAIDMGIVSSKARREIVQVLRTLIAMHTLYPISDHYITICQKLIAKFPKTQGPNWNKWLCKCVLFCFYQKNTYFIYLLLVTSIYVHASTGVHGECR